MATKVPVFVSFDYDHDNDLKVMVIGQAKNDDSPFSVIDHSIKDASPNWKAEARKRIRRADQVIIICGEHTDTATGVDVEIKIAREEERPYFLLKGRADKVCKKPKAALSADEMYKWTWANLKILIGGGR